MPLLDEHVMTDEKGEPVAEVDRRVLEQIAANNNARVRRTGDPATLILGHTSDDPADPEKPAKGFAVNYRVAPFRRDERTGKVLYAIHGDLKVRHKNKHLIEEYPRRSVELWWNKKELDPIALLGGSSPERDLGVVIRNARINHVGLTHTPRAGARARGGAAPAGEVIRFSTRGPHTVETYTIAEPRRLGRGGRQMMDDDEDCGPDRYADADTDAADIDPETDDQNDPELARVMQSKWAKGLDSKISGMESKLDMILQALEGGGQPGEEMGAGPEGEDTEGTEDMPEPGSEPPEDMPDEEPDEEPTEDERRMHGQKPVQMSGTSAMPGPMNAYVPSTNGKKKGASRMSRQRTARPQPGPSEVVRLKRQVTDLKLKYAAAQAQQMVQGLEGEGILFGPTPEAHDRGRDETARHLTALLMQDDGGEDDVAYELDVIRTRYARKRPDPASPASVGLARFARTPAPRGKDADEEDEDFDAHLTNEQAVQFADLQTGPRKMSRLEAQKFMRKKYGIR